MLASREVEIKGHKYKFNMFVATKGLEILNRIISLLGEAGGSLFDGLGFAASAKALVSQLGKSDVVSLVKEMLTASNILIDGQKMQGEKTFDLWFAGKYDALVELLIEIWGHNFENFFDVINSKYQMIQVDKIAVEQEAGAE